MTSTESSCARPAWPYAAVAVLRIGIIADSACPMWAVGTISKSETRRNNRVHGWVVDQTNVCPRDFEVILAILGPAVSPIHDPVLLRVDCCLPYRIRH